MHEPHLHAPPRQDASVCQLSAGEIPTGVAGQAGNSTMKFTFQTKGNYDTLERMSHSVCRVINVWVKMVQCDVRYMKLATDIHEETETDRAYEEDSDEEQVTVYFKQ